MSSEVEELERLIEVAKLKVLNSEQYLRSVEDLDPETKAKAEEIMRKEYTDLQELYARLAEIETLNAGRRDV